MIPLLQIDTSVEPGGFEFKIFICDWLIYEMQLLTALILIEIWKFV